MTKLRDAWLQGSYTGLWMMLGQPAAWQPPADVYETDNGLVVRVEIAGMRVEDFDVTLTGNLLRISGVREERACSYQQQRYYRMEIPSGPFTIEVSLPWIPHNFEAVTATYRDGFLTITIPRPQPRALRIQTGEREEP